ncbi:MAG TPA: hypothetical protein VMW72_19055 [Sedimentisphaerales bacterium]|nr:hypothetical protein [Sedimentisphaerales bacterium]
MTSDAKVGLLLGLVFIFTIAFIINGLPKFINGSDSNAINQHNNELRTKLSSIVKVYTYEVTDPNKEQTISWLTPEVQDKIVENIFQEVILASKTRNQEKEAVEKAINEIEERIRNIEMKFPDETDLSKASLLNNALLSIRIDQLAKQVDQIQSQILTKWDFALIYCAITAGIITIAGSTSAILKAIKKHNRRYHY